MKKLLTAIVISALCLGLCSGALAEGENVISADEFNGSAQPTAAPGEESAVCNPEEAGKVQRVFDLAELLTDDEEAELQSRINELVAKDGQDIGIVTVEDESVMSTQEFADEFYENSGMGIGENRTGVLFCIDMYNRETYLTTTGDMIDIIDDQRREEIFDAQMEYLANGDYMGAFSEALDYTDKFIEMGVADDHTGINAATGEVMDPSERAEGAAVLGGVGGLIGLLAGLIAKSSIQKSYARKYVPSEYNWRAKSKLNLRVNDSKLVNKFVTTRVIPRNNDSGPRSGGGGHSTSTVHMSSTEAGEGNSNLSRK